MNVPKKYEISARAPCLSSASSTRLAIDTRTSGKYREYLRTRDLTLRSAAILFFLTLAAFLVMGYHPGAEDDFVYLPAIKHDLNPALFPHDADFFRLQLQATVFDKVVAASAKLTHLPLEWVLLCWQLGAIFLVLFGCYKIAKRCFHEPHAQWAGVTLIASLLMLPVAGTSLFLLDQHLHPRALATGLILLAIADVLDRRWTRVIISIAIAFAFHPIMAAFGASFCAFLAWPESAGKSFRERTRQATTALMFLMPMGWIFEKPSAAWREAAATRDYYFLGRQQWYEWLGTLAPLLLLWWFARLGRHDAESAKQSSSPVARNAMPLICRRLIWFALFQFAVTLAIMLPPQIVRFRTLQPLRYLHLVYFLMLIMGGGLIGRYILKAKIWRWVVLFLPLAAGMFYSQREEFSASAHIEIGPAIFRNEWVRTFEWVRRHTPEDAYFALGPKYYAAPGEDWHSFRAIAERSQLADALKDPSVSTQVPRLALRWQRESHAQDGWAHFQLADFQRLQREFGVNWVIVDRDVSGLACLYRDAHLRVCRVV